MKNAKNNDQYKLVVSDIDGTIKCFTQPISAFTKKVIDDIRQKGFLFTLATGRHLPTARIFADELNVDLPLVLVNGCIVQTFTGEVLHHVVLPAEITQRVVEIADDLNIRLLLFVDDQVYIKRKKGNNKSSFSHHSEWCHEISDWAEDFHQLNAVNKCAFHERDSQEKIKLLEAVCEKEISEKAERYRVSAGVLEIVPRGISKAVGVEKLVAHLGLQMDQVIAFGDYDNDAELLAKAGLGIAVENATEKVKASADLVIGPCDEDGPAKFLHELIRK